MSKKRTLTEKDFVAGGYGEFLGDKERHGKKAKEDARVEPTATDATLLGRIALSKAPPFDFDEVESQLGWWLAIQRGDVRLFEAWLALHGAIVIADRTVAVHDAFFEKLSRRGACVEEHAAGFVYRRR